MYMLILNFVYPLRCLRIPPVEYHWLRRPRCRWEYKIRMDLGEIWWEVVD